MGMSLLGFSMGFSSGCSSSFVFSAMMGFLRHPAPAKSVPAAARSLFHGSAPER
jgi:hypothetical protein